VADKNDKVKQPNGIQRWYRETMGELRKVSWPTRQDAQRLTWIVVAVMVVMSMVLGILDYVFSSLVTLILS
jgi:preprotein translocase subunit SecE